MGVRSQPNTCFLPNATNVGKAVRHRRCGECALAAGAASALYPSIQPDRAANVISAAIVVGPDFEPNIMHRLGHGGLWNRSRFGWLRHVNYHLGWFAGIIRNRTDVHIKVREEAVEELP